MASGGDGQEEKGNSLPRTRLLRFCSTSNDADENDEDEAKRTVDGEKHISPRYIATLTNNVRTGTIPDGETQAHSQDPDESLASAGDDQQEKGGKRSDDDKNHLATNSTSTINLRTETIPGGEIPVHCGDLTSPTLINQATENAMGPHGLVAVSSSMADIIFPESSSTDEVIYSRTPLSPAIESQGEGIMAASGHRNVTSLSQFHLGNSPSFPHIPETSDPDIDFVSESRTISTTEGEFASSFSRADQLIQREPSVHTILSEHSMEVREIPVMLAGDGDDLYNTCAIDSVLMMILVMVLVHPPLSANLVSSSDEIFNSLWYIVFMELYIYINMGAIRRYWANRISNFPGPNCDRLDFVSMDLRIIEPLLVATQLFLQIEYRCRNNRCRYHRYTFQQCFSTLCLVQRFLGRFVCNFDVFYGILNADIVQMAISNFISSPQEEDHRDSCPGVIRTMIQQPPPFFFLDVGDMWISTENARDLLGRTIRIQQEQYIISAMTIYNEGHPENNHGHYYSLMYIQELDMTVIYDNQYGILMNCFSMFQLNQWYSYAGDCLNNGRGYPRETVCLIMLLRIS
ncbi:uncharacterized protein LOC127702940 [Mytilus californianus]|uniref:uncharacterized protein LOC127702940 n=1 Tax=Mytilus californianus TaxID=6549 RepID=UPI0022465CA4|nr:uncharacterized protein LOC127702940 [Mytilus californianus]